MRGPPFPLRRLGMTCCPPSPGLYRGSLAYIGGGFPSQITYFASYKVAKEHGEAWFGDSVPPVVLHATCGIIADFCGASPSAPLFILFCANEFVCDASDALLDPCGHRGTAAAIAGLIGNGAVQKRAQYVTPPHFVCRLLLTVCACLCSLVRAQARFA